MADTLMEKMRKFQDEAVSLAIKTGLLQYCSEHTQKRALSGEATIEEILSDSTLERQIEDCWNADIHHIYI